MPQQTYEVKAPDGSILEFQSDHQPTEKEIQRALQTLQPDAAPPAGKSAGTWEDRGIAGKVWRPLNGGRERTREDNSLLGLPPELAVTSGLGIGRAVAGAGAGLASKAVAGAKAVAGQAAPAVKYELTKSALEGAGMPPSVAVPIALAVSGYQRGGKTARATAARAKAPTAKTPPPGPVPMKPGMAANEAEVQRALEQMIAAGKTPEEAQALLIQLRSASAFKDLPHAGQMTPEVRAQRSRPGVR